MNNHSRINRSRSALLAGIVGIVAAAAVTAQAARPPQEPPLLSRDQARSAIKDRLQHMRLRRDTYLQRRSQEQQRPASRGAGGVLPAVPRDPVQLPPLENLQ